MGSGMHIGPIAVLGVLFAACRGEPQPAAPAADSCSRWVDEVCKRTGVESETCEAARGASPLLSPAACATSLATPGFLDERMAQRARRCTELTERLCADLGPRTRACKRARERSPQLTPEVCQRTLSDYARTRDELASQPDKLRVSRATAAELSASDAPARGHVAAKLQLVEFLDYESSYSAQAASVLRTLTAAHGDRLRLVIRMFPLPEHAHARLAAEAALAAHAQGKFWELHDWMLSHQNELDRTALERAAAGLQLNVPAFKAALDTHRYAAAVDADLALVEELSITAMPALFLNGERILNGVDQKLLLDAAEEYLAKAE